MNNAQPQPGDATAHEQLFSERYDRLLRWALHLTGNDRAQAEDLLHDAYIQFTLLRPPLAAIRQLDNYLFGVLRILRVSQLRRAARWPHQPFNIVEYDSAQLGLRLSDPRRQQQLHDELRAVCRYACARKATSKAGSVLLLRFFHGYYPSEIVRLLRTTRKVVDARLLAARREARLYCEAPERLTFLTAPARNDPARNERSKTVSKLIPALTAEDLLHSLRQEIFAAPSGECFAVRELYQNASAPALTTAQLSHLVSCPACLDEANALLELPPLAARHPHDVLGMDTRNRAQQKDNDDDDNDEGNGNTNLTRTAEADARETFEHRPRELRIALNGVLQSSQMINAAFSEQMLVLSVGQDSILPHTQQAAFAQTLYATEFAESASFIEVFSEQGVRLALLPLPPLAPCEQSIALSDERTLTLSLARHADDATLRVCYHDPLFEPLPELNEEAAAAPLRAVAVPPAATVGWRERLTAFWPRPAWAFAALCLLAVLAALRFWPAANTTVTAAELLQKSLAAESRLHSDRALVVHRRYQLEVRAAATQRLLAQRQLERWSNAAQTVTHKQSSDTLAPGERWLLEQSLANFAARAAQATRARVEEQAENFVLHYEFDNTPSVPGVLQAAALTVNKASLRAVSQSWRVNAPPQTLQYDLRETAFERIAAEQAPPHAFMPDADVSVTTAPPIALNAPNQTDVAPAPTAVDLAALEIEARSLLDQADANLGEQISVTRTPDGKLVINALVETDARKTALAQTLAPLSNHPAVTLKLATYAESARQQSRATHEPAVTQIEAAAASFPAEAELRRYFAAQGVSAAQLDERLTQFANRAQRQAALPLRHARALNTLTRQFSAAELAALAPEAKAKWLRLVRTHAQAAQRETAVLRELLQPVFAADSGNNEGNLPDDFNAAVKELLALTAQHDDVVNTAFIASTNEAGAVALKAKIFWQSLRRAEALAARLAQRE